MSAPRATLRRTWWDAFMGRGPDTAFDRYLVTTPIYRPMQTATEIVRLTFTVFRVVVTPPFTWVREMVVETSHSLRVVTLPALFASAVYVMAFGSVLFGNVIYALGAPDRIGPGFYIGLLRELGPWLSYMILAGVVASSLAGDLGARKIREEIDALDVLGVDKMRTLIVPRVVAITVCCVILTFLVVAFDWITAMLLNQYTIEQPFASSVEAAVLAFNVYDVVAALIKSVIIGFFIGVVACQKGLSARGGAEGVGRAVAETVIITFFGLWLINSLYNTGYLTLLPETIGIRG